MVGLAYDGKTLASPGRIRIGGHHLGNDRLVYLSAANHLFDGAIFGRGGCDRTLVGLDTQIQIVGYDR